MRFKPSLLPRLFGDDAGSVRGKAGALLALLIAANLGAWGWALAAFGMDPVLLGTALLAYGLGLRHAVDADHIAAIDNVTRKSLQQSKYPVGIGFFFSLGHSTVVVLASVAVAVTAALYQRHMDGFHRLGGMIGTLVSAIFLFAIAGMNIVVFMAVHRKFRQVRSGAVLVEDDIDMLLAKNGFFARLFRPLFRLVARSWHMYPLGLLFGLGFDTATEISLLGISAAEVAKGLSIWSILVFPALFTAGMSLIDTADGIVMLGVYGWAFVKPIRKLYYNLTVTFISALVALLVGGIELLGLMGDRLVQEGHVWAAIRAVNAHFGTLGLLIIGIFGACWALSLLFYRIKGYDKRDVAAPVS